MTKMLSTSGKLAALLLVAATFAAAIAIATGQPARALRSGFGPSWRRTNFARRVNQRLHQRPAGVPVGGGSATTAAAATTIPATATATDTATVTNPVTATATDPASTTATNPVTATATDPASTTATNPVSTVTDPASTTATNPVTPTVTDPASTTATNPVTATATDPVGTTAGTTSGAATCTPDDAKPFSELGFPTPLCDSCSSNDGPAFVPNSDCCSSSSLLGCGCNGCTSLSLDDCYVETRSDVVGDVLPSDVNNKPCVIIEHSDVIRGTYIDFQCVIARGAHFDAVHPGTTHFIYSTVAGACAVLDGVTAIHTRLELTDASAFVAAYNSETSWFLASTIVADSSDIRDVNPVGFAASYFLLDSTLNYVATYSDDDVFLFAAGSDLGAVSLRGGDDTVIVIDTTTTTIVGGAGDDCIMIESSSTNFASGAPDGGDGDDECTLVVNTNDAVCVVALPAFCESSTSSACTSLEIGDCGGF